MNRSDLEGLAAVVNFNCSLIQILCIVVIVANWFGVQKDQYLFRIIDIVTEPFFLPIKKIFRVKNLESNISPVVVLFLSIPIQFILVHHIRTL